MKLPSCRPNKKIWEFRLSWPVTNLTNKFWEVLRSWNWRNFFSCSNFPILDSYRTALFRCPPPPLHLKLGLTNLIVNSLFSRNPILLEKHIADQLGIARKEYHLKDDNVRHYSLAVLFWRRWFHHRIIHWLNAFTVLWLAFSVKS